MMIIEVYPHCGTWAFTDTARGLVHEPFVCGIPEMIDYFIQNWGEPGRKKHRITFSDKKFPGAQGMLRRNSFEHDGAWYTYGDFDGWLCPATLKYFTEMPKEIFIKLD